jgi:hypothetical protein
MFGVVMENKEPIYCALAFGSVSLDQLGYKPCCGFITSNLWKDGYHARDINDPALIQVRNSLSRGTWHSGCQSCKDAEANSGTSMRTIWNKELGPDIPISSVIDPNDVKYLDLTISNKCNSKCMTCSPQLSNIWGEEWQYIWKTSSQKKPRGVRLSYEAINGMNWAGLTKENNYLQINIKDDQINKLIELYPNVKRIAFVGGEPTIHEEAVRMCQELIRLDRAKNITISYVTNLTGLNPELIKIWNEFKSVHLTVSIDGVGKVNEYIRYPFKWKKIESNVIQMFEYTKLHPDRYSLSLSHTVSALNIIDSADLLEWWWDMSCKFNLEGEWREYGIFLNKVWSPMYVKTNILSELYRLQGLTKLNKVEEKIQNQLTDLDKQHNIFSRWKDQFDVLKNWLTEPQEVYPSLLNQFLYFIEHSDQFRKRNIADYLPYLIDELNKMSKRSKDTLLSIGPGYEQVYDILSSSLLDTPNVEELDKIIYKEVIKYMPQAQFYKGEVVKHHIQERKPKIGMPHLITEYNDLLSSDISLDLIGVTVIVPLEQLHDIRVVPGSHEKDWLHKELASGSVDQHFKHDSIELDMPIGSMLLFNSRLLHSTSIKKVTKNYPYVLITYIRSDIIEDVRKIDTE